MVKKLHLTDVQKVNMGKGILVKWRPFGQKKRAGAKRPKYDRRKEDI